MQYLDDKYSNPVKNELLDMSSLMDPRFHTTYIDPEKVEQIKKRAVTELMSLPAEKSTPQQPGPAVQVCQREAHPPPNFSCFLQEECARAIFSTTRGNESGDRAGNLPTDTRG